MKGMTLLATGFSLLMLQACATYQRPESLTAQMARTEAVLQQAESSGAKENALPELEQARDKYARAKVQLGKESASADRTALRLAREAEADAKYAAAKAQAQRQQQSAREVREGTQALSDEAQRNAGNTPAASNY